MLPRRHFVLTNRKICSECGREFSKAEHLERHIRTHTKERPYICGACGKGYVRKDTLSRHEKSHHKHRARSSSSDGFAASAPMAQVSEAFISPPAPDFLDTQFDLNSLSTIISGDYDFDSLIQDFWSTNELQTAFGSSGTGSGSNSGGSNNNIANASSAGYSGDSRDSRDSGDSNTEISPTTTTCSSCEFQGEIGEPPTKKARRSSFLDDNSGINIDEKYREGIERRLTYEVRQDSLPSAAYLNLCIKLYFLRFNPVFPLLHVSTFRCVADNSLLFLSICSIGSLFIGTATAKSNGVKLFERLNKAILATWEQFYGSGIAHLMTTVQAALIGQTFAILSDNPKHWDIAEAFHGSVVAWARKAGMLTMKNTEVKIHEGMTMTELDNAWKKWARNEEMLRVGLALRIHDAELSRMFQHEPLLRHHNVLEKLPRAANDELFAAPTAELWADLMQRAEPSQAYSPVLEATQLSSSQFLAYSILEGINASVCECAFTDDLSDDKINAFVSDLTSWHQGYTLGLLSKQHQDNCSLLTLWHATFIVLFSNVGMLWKVNGSEGPSEAVSHNDQAATWASTPHANRCYIHCVLMKKNFEGVKTGTEPAMHVARCLFLAALACYSFVRFRGSSEHLPLAISDAEEFSSLQDDAIAAQGEIFQDYDGLLQVDILASYMNVLKRLGPWGVSNQFESVLRSILEWQANEVTIEPWVHLLK